MEERDCSWEKGWASHDEEKESKGAELVEYVFVGVTLCEDCADTERRDMQGDVWGKMKGGMAGTVSRLSRMERVEVTL